MGRTPRIVVAVSAVVLIQSSVAGLIVADDVLRGTRTFYSGLASSAAPRLTAADDVWQKSLAMYAALGSYADSGTVVWERGSSSKDQHTFTTLFKRSPRGFQFDFRKQGGDRVVIWGDPDAFHTWWKTTGGRDDYPNPNNLGAFSTADYLTSGSAMKVPLLLYSKAPLQGTFTHFTDAVQDGTDVVAGHQCYRLLGTTRDVYGATGHAVNLRRLTVWVDANSLLIRKTLEEPKDQLPGQRSRTITTFEPQANPSLDDARFRFTPPEAN
jgi:outer membrane lipoprotein-sorting protein